LLGIDTAPRCCSVRVLGIIWPMTSVFTIVVSLPTDQVKRAREAVACGEALSLSTYISTALAAFQSPCECAEGDSLADLVADMIAEDGVPSVEDYAWADKVLGLSGSGGTCASST
jgi:hypothetical protein